MLKRNDEAKGIEVDIVLTEAEQAILSSYVKQQGFDILQKLMEDQVRKFNLKLTNTPIDQPETVLANHILAKGVAQWYVGLMNRLEHELQVTTYNNRASNIDNPVNDMQISELA